MYKIELTAHEVIEVLCAISLAKQIHIENSYELDEDSEECEVCLTYAEEYGLLYNRISEQRNKQDSIMK